MAQENSSGITERQSKKIDQLLSLAQSPMAMIKNAGKFGIKGGKRFLGITLLFSAVNFILIVAAIVVWIGAGYEMGSLWHLLIAILLCIGITAFASFKAYRYALTQVSYAIYLQLSPFFRKLCGKLVDKAKKKLGSGDSIDKSDVAVDMNAESLLEDDSKKASSYVKRGLNFILKRIPIVGMLIEIKDEIKLGSRDEATDALYHRLNTYVEEEIFGGNNTRWTFILLPLNVVVAIVLMSLM